MAFDALSVDGMDLSSLPLVERRSRLLSSVPDEADLHDGPDRHARCREDWLTNAHALHLEGVVAKKATEPYRPRTALGSR